jgi:hypothetical protein
MPSIAWPRPTLAQPSRNRRAELQHPTPHRFIGDVEPALGQQFLHFAVAQREAEIALDRVDDLGRKTMPAIAERSHAATLTLRAALARPVSVTKPTWVSEDLTIRVRGRDLRIKNANSSHGYDYTAFGHVIERVYLVF